MSKYEIEKKIHSCSVDKKLIDELEKYILSTVKEGADDLEVINDNFKLCIFDEFGYERMGSISEYHRDVFPNDTRKVCICYQDYSNKYGKIIISFSREDYSSEIKIECKGDNAKEKANGILKAIESHINEFKNYNFLFYGKYEIIPFIVLGASFVGIISCVIALIKNQQLGYIEVIGTLLFIFSCICFIVSKASPYCVIDTIKNRKTQKVILWFLSGLAGVLIFGVIATLIRKKLFGI